MSKTTVTVVLAAFGLLTAEAKDWYRHFDLGAGVYSAPTGAMELDVARSDWSYLGIGNVGADMNSVQYLNRLFAMNPKHKVVIRFWPTAGYRLKTDDPKAPERQVTHFAYRYRPEARETLLKECRAQLDIFLKNVTHPQNIYGYTLKEELPFHFGEIEILNTTDPKADLGEMKEYAAQYKAETGKELKEWNLDVRRWWAKTFAWTIRDFYSTFKKEYPELHGFVYLMSHYRPLEWVEPGEELHAYRVLPCKWSDMIEPGVAADGFFAYCNNERWTKLYQKLATEHHWPYFSQLSHTSNMRIAGWKECLAIGNSPIPENLGYFYYEWDFTYGWWNDDLDIAPEDVGNALARFRQHFAKENVNPEIVRRYVKPEVVYSHDLARTDLRSFGMAVATVMNNQSAKWFRTAEEATLKNVKVKLAVPPEFSIPDTASCAPEVTIDRIAPGEHKSVMWWFRRDRPSPDNEKMDSSVTVVADGVEPVVVKSTKGVDTPVPQTEFTVARSGDTFRYIDWGKDWGAEPVEITIQPRGSVIDPAIQLGESRLVWRGEIPNNKLLILGPGKKAAMRGPWDKEAVDVTDRLMGTPLAVSKGVSEFTYFDYAAPSTVAKAKITVRLVKPEKK